MPLGNVLLVDLIGLDATRSESARAHDTESMRRGASRMISLRNSPPRQQRDEFVQELFREIVDDLVWILAHKSQLSHVTLRLAVHLVSMLITVCFLTHLTIEAQLCEAAGLHGIANGFP